MEQTATYQDTIHDQQTPPPAPQGPDQLINAPQVTNKLQRDPDGLLGGVASGIARYLGVDPVIIRLCIVAGTLFYATGLLLYLAAWLVIPSAPRPVLPPAPAVVT